LVGTNVIGSLPTGDRRPIGLWAGTIIVMRLLAQLPTEPDHCVALPLHKDVPRVSQAVDLGEIQRGKLNAAFVAAIIDAKEENAVPLRAISRPQA
jgi:hypothetical protein